MLNKKQNLKIRKEAKNKERGFERKREETNKKEKD